MIVIDTTVLSYAVGVEHLLRDPCIRLLRAHADGAIDAATTIEVVQEFVHVRARRRSRADAVNIARRYTAALSLLATRLDDLELGLNLFGSIRPSAPSILCWPPSRSIDARRHWCQLTALSVRCPASAG